MGRLLVSFQCVLASLQNVPNRLTVVQNFCSRCAVLILPQSPSLFTALDPFLPLPLIFSLSLSLSPPIALGVHFPFGADRRTDGQTEWVSERATSNGFIQKRGRATDGQKEKPNNGGSQCRFSAPSEANTAKLLLSSADGREGGGD